VFINFTLYILVSSREYTASTMSKNRMLITRVEPEIRWLIEELAEAAGQQKSEYLRHIITVHLERIGVLSSECSKKLVEA